MNEIFSLLDEELSELLQEISFNYGLLIYLKEELETLKDNSYKFFVKYYS